MKGFKDVLNKDMVYSIIVLFGELCSNHNGCGYYINGGITFWLFIEIQIKKICNY